MKLVVETHFVVYLNGALRMCKLAIRSTPSTNDSTHVHEQTEFLATGHHIISFNDAASTHLPSTVSVGIAMFMSCACVCARPACVRYQMLQAFGKLALAVPPRIVGCAAPTPHIHLNTSSPPHPSVEYSHALSRALVQTRVTMRSQVVMCRGHREKSQQHSLSYALVCVSLIG